MDNNSSNSKSRGRRSKTSGSSRKGDGASSSSNRSNNGSAAQMNRLEQDVAAKTRARGSTRAGTGSALSQMEQDVIAKTRASQGHSENWASMEDQPTVSDHRPRSKSSVAPLDQSEEHIASNKKNSNNSRRALEAFNDECNSTSTDNEKHTPEDPSHEFQTSFTFDGIQNEFDKLGDDTFHASGKDYSSSPPESAPPQTIAAHGIANQPDVEYGTYNGGDGHGFGDTLAVAIAVSPDEEDAFIPSAIEYEPDSKPPIYKNRRFRFYVVFATIGLVAIGVSVAFTVTSSQNKGSPAPTPAPTTLRETTTILPQLTAIVGEVKLSDTTSMHALAANWILNEDPLQLPQEADNLIQRYLLALFYLSTTTPERKWLSCNPPVGDEDSLCNFTKLAQVWPEVAYENITWGRWLSEEHECNWAGVFCDEFNQTRAIELPGQEIRGTFPSEIALMPYLQSLTFNWNEFYGTMPSELASMKHLLNIELHYNFFTGQVPPEWYEAQALQRINFAANYLSGTIPTQIGQLSTMKGFFSFENSIGGTIPTEIGMMKFLSFTRWGRNFMTGTLPTEVGNLEKLQEMWFHRNQFTGKMPSEMGNMRDLGDLRLHFNLFTGPVPEEHYNMPQLRRWDLYDCNLTSTISTKIGLMTNLDTYRIRENNFYGTIPTEMGELYSLTSAWMHRNSLTGTVPVELCANRGDSGLAVLDADCGPTNGIGAPMLECMLDCCTACCDTVTGYCAREVEVDVEVQTTDNTN